MARMNPVNTSFQVPDHRPIFDQVDMQPRNQEFENKPSYAAFNRGGGGFRAGGGRGGGRRCYGCQQLGHVVRDCPERSENQASASDSSQGGVIRFNSGTNKARPKPINASAEVLTNSKPMKHELSPKNVDVNPLLEQKEKELQRCRQEISHLKIQLDKVTKDLNSSQANNEQMIINVNKIQEDLFKSRTELSLLRDKDNEMAMRWLVLNNEFKETKDELNQKIEELEEINEIADAEIMNLKLETEQWRKAAKAIASVFVGGAEISSKTPELESLVLYYSDRAAKRMSLGKTRKALDDCRMASRLDPGFLKVCLTAGSCHLVLGEINEALYNFKKCLDSGIVCLDRRLTIEASDRLRNAEKVVSCISQSAELLQLKTLESAIHALELITEALSISCFSEKLLKLKGEALFMLHKYEEVIQMCEQTLVSAEKNFTTTGDSKQISEEDQKQSLNLWRWNLISRSYFHMAKFDLALAILEKYEQLAPPETKIKGQSSSSVATISELLRCKNEGNEAFKSGKYREAAELYSTAVTRGIESRHFTAICLCNRAAANQALGKVIDAIADCNFAIALDGDYMKAISRRANLHEKIRNYDQAAIDFQRLVSLLEKQSEAKYVKELTLARQHLASTNRNKKIGMKLDLYLILGLKGSESGSEIKKAYHKSALRHHPDKAGKFLARSERGADDHVWKEIFTTIHKDADKLFKMIGEAYAVLSDTNKRSKYNREDGMKDDFWWEP